MHLGTNTQASGVTQGLIAAKYRLAKKSLMIPRLELMSGNMAVNLSTNVQAALEGFNMIEDKQCWLDSTNIWKPCWSGEPRQQCEWSGAMVERSAMVVRPISVACW